MRRVRNDKDRGTSVGRSETNQIFFAGLHNRTIRKFNVNITLNYNVIYYDLFEYLTIKFSTLQYSISTVHYSTV